MSTNTLDTGTTDAEPTTRHPVQRSLPAAHRACAVCGVAVEPDERGEFVHGTETVESLPERTSANPDRPNRGVTYEFGRCTRCAARRALASQITASDDRPGWRRRWNDQGAVAAAEAVLIVLDVLGRPRAEAEAPDAHRTLAGLVVPGRSMRWAAQFVPVPDRDLNARCAAAWPWSHVDTEATGPREARETAAASYAQVLAARVAASTASAPGSDRPVPAPASLDAHPETATQHDERGRAHPHVWADGGRYVQALGGCLLCGVAAASDWTPASCSPNTLGGPTSRIGGRRAVGFTCPDCTDAVRASDQIVGPTARDLALNRYLTARDPFEAPLNPWDGYEDASTPAWVVLAVRARLRAERGIPTQPVTGYPEPWQYLAVYRAARAAAQTRTRAAAVERDRAERAARSAAARAPRAPRRTAGQGAR